MEQTREYRLEKLGERRYRLMIGTGIVGFIVWKDNCGGKGFWFNPRIQRRPSRILRPTILETLQKSVRLPAKIARELADSVGHDS